MKITNVKTFKPNTRPFACNNNRCESKGEVAKKIGVALTCVGATLLPIITISKHQGKLANLTGFKDLALKDKGKALFKAMDIDYGFKEMMTVGLTSILGGVTGGVLFDKETNPKKKIQEGINKAAVLAVPAGLVAAGLKAFEHTKVKNPFASIASVVVGVGVGMPIANKISNTINKKVFGDDVFEKRNLKPTDYFVHVDDVVGAMVLSKVPFANKLHLDKVLGAIYAHQAYEAGSAK